MKINEKDVVKWSVYVLLACCCGLLEAHIIKLVCDIFYDVMEKWLSPCLVFMICMAISMLALLMLLVLLVTIVIKIETTFPDGVQVEPTNQSEVSEAEAESQTKVAIRSDHGDNLKEVMEAIRHEEWEYNAVFDSSGRKLAEGTYQSPKICSIAPEDWQEVNRYEIEVIDLHNHPSGSAFSPQDFRVFMRHDIIKQFIVVSRKHNYILVKPEGSYEGLQDEVKSYAKMMHHKYFWLKDISFWLWSVIAAKKTAEKFGLEFRIERVPRSATRKKAFRIGLATCATLALCCISFLRPAESSATSPVSAASSTTRYSSPVEATITINGATYSLTGDIISVGCDPIKDPYIQGHAPVGGGPNYNN